MIPLYLTLSPVFVPVLLEALGPRRPQAARRLVRATLAAASLTAAGQALFGVPVAVLFGAMGAAFTSGRAADAGVFGAALEAALIVCLVAVVLTAGRVVLASDSLSATLAFAALFALVRAYGPVARRGREAAARAAS